MLARNATDASYGQREKSTIQSGCGGDGQFNSIRSVHKELWRVFSLSCQIQSGKERRGEERMSRGNQSLVTKLHAQLPGCWSAHCDLEDPHPRVSFDPVAEEAWRGLSSVLWTNLRGDASQLFEDLPTIQEEGITSRSWEKASTKCRRILFSACLDGDLNLAKVALSTSITPQKQPTFAKCLFAVLSHQYWMLNIEWNWILNWIILNIY